MIAVPAYLNSFDRTLGVRDKEDRIITCFQIYREIHILSHFLKNPLSVPLTNPLENGTWLLKFKKKIVIVLGL